MRRFVIEQFDQKDLHWYICAQSVGLIAARGILDACVKDNPETLYRLREHRYMTLEIRQGNMREVILSANPT